MTRPRYMFSKMRFHRRHVISVLTILFTIYACISFLENVNLNMKRMYRKPNQGTLPFIYFSEKNSTQPISKTTTEADMERQNETKEEKFQAELPRPKVTQVLPHDVLQRNYFQIKYEEALLYGKFRPYKGFLTIGIPSVRRKGVSYLELTLKSLLEQTHEAERAKVVIIVFLTDANHTWIIERATQLYKVFQKSVDDGFLQIVHPHHMAYPNFQLLERSFNDSRARVAWRSKQNLDFAYLMTYSRNISDYYLQLEDDVIVAKNYINNIKKYVKTYRSKWFVINFSLLGFIGKFFRSSDLPILTNFLLLFFADKPCDLLLNDVRKLKGQEKDINARPSQFQHIGVVSSLANKTQKLQDKGFRDVSFIYSVGSYNPRAQIFTNLNPYKNYKAEKAYEGTVSYFWTVEPKMGSYYRIVFDKHINISSFSAISGHHLHPNDTLHDTSVSFSHKTRTSSIAVCSELERIGEFVGGVFDTKTLNVKSESLQNIGCISIDIKKDHKQWVILRHINVTVV